MNSPFRRLFPVLAATLAVSAFGQDRPLSKQRALPDYDARDAAVSASPLSAGNRAIASRAAAVERSVATRNPGSPLRAQAGRFGAPKSVSREGGPLMAAAGRRAEDAASAFLREQSALFQFSGREVSEMRLTGRDAGRSATFLTYNQTVGGVDVFNGHLKFTFSPQGDLMHVAAGEIAPQVRVTNARTLSAEEAGKAAVALLEPRQAKLRSRAPELVAFPVDGATARLAWRVFVDAGPRERYEMLVDAETGDLLIRHNTWLRAEAQGRVWKKWPRVGTYDLTSFPDSWLPSSGTVTTGNNVDAFLDSNGDDEPDPLNTQELKAGRAYSESRVFDFPFGDGYSFQDPTNYLGASVLNLFYFVNTAHDYFYGLGFDEAAGNFQNDNFGKGGTGGDAVLAAAQYAGAEDNAAFGPTPEGEAPQLVMGIFAGRVGARLAYADSDFDGMVAIHEYAHGVTNRLVGSRTSTSCLDNTQSGAMGEGWSDYFAISLFDSSVVSPYLGFNTRGIRRYDYEGYPFKFEDIGNAGYEVHNDGEIWAATLWDLRKSLGATVTDQLVMNGLKATPCNPSMLDARDAILAADAATNGGANRAAIWTVFARHGMGYSAAAIEGSPSTGTIYDAAYDEPPAAGAEALNPKITSNPLETVPRYGERFNYTVTATNPNNGTLSFQLMHAPVGMTIDSATGAVTWIAGMSGHRVKIAVTDGKGGKVVHGFLLPVVTPVSLDASQTISAGEGEVGYFSLNVPADVPTAALQVTLRGASGDADLDVISPSGSSYTSGRTSSSETITIPEPKAGKWTIQVTGYEAFDGVTLQATMLTPTPLQSGTVLNGLSGDVTSETLYKVTVPFGATRLTVATSGGEGNVALLARHSRIAACPNSSYLSSYCIKDAVSSHAGNEESISIPNPSSGDWYFDVLAITAYSGVQLTVTVDVPPLVVSANSLTFSAVTGASPASQQILVSTGATPVDWTATAATEGGGNWLSVTPASGNGAGAVQVSVNSAALAEGTYKGSVTLSSTAGQSVVAVTLTMSAATTPVVAAGGVIGAGASSPFVTALSPGGFISIFGTGLAAAGTSRAANAADIAANNGSLPTNLAGTCVDVGGKPAFLSYVGFGQVNFQTPAIPVGAPVDIVVRLNCGGSPEIRSAAVQAATQTASPEFLFWTHPASGKYPVVAVNAVTYSYIGDPDLIAGLTFAPAKPGDYVTVYGVSFGPTTPASIPGMPPAAISNCDGAYVVRLGDQTLAASDVLYVGGSSGAAGLYQMNIRIPSGFADGSYPLTLTVNGATTPAGYLSVKN